jgi:preprotein translocase subunit SecE
MVKKNNILLWIFSISVFTVAIVNQQVINYKHIFLQFIITSILCIIALIITFTKTTQGVKLAEYIAESLVELKKVTWPSRQETTQTTLAVVIMVIVMGVILWTVDAILIRVVSWLLQRGV